MAVLIMSSPGRLFRCQFQPRSTNQHDNVVVIEALPEMLAADYRKDNARAVIAFGLRLRNSSPI